MHGKPTPKQPWQRGEWEDSETTRLVTVDGREWLILLHWEEVEGSLEVVGVEIWSRPPDDWRQFSGYDLRPAPLTSTLIRKLNLGGLIEEARQRKVRTAKYVAEQRDFPTRTRAAAARTVATAGRRLDSDHFKAVAEVYEKAWVAGKDPTRAVVRHFSVPYSTAARWVHRARNEFHLLPGTRRGRASAG